MHSYINIKNTQKYENINIHNYQRINAQKYEHINTHNYRHINIHNYHYIHIQHTLGPYLWPLQPPNVGHFGVCFFLSFWPVSNFASDCQFQPSAIQKSFGIMGEKLKTPLKPLNFILLRCIGGYIIRVGYELMIFSGHNFG